MLGLLVLIAHRILLFLLFSAQEVPLKRNIAVSVITIIIVFININIIA